MSQKILEVSNQNVLIADVHLSGEQRLTQKPIHLAQKTRNREMKLDEDPDTSVRRVVSRNLGSVSPFY